MQSSLKSSRLLVLIVSLASSLLIVACLSKLSVLDFSKVEADTIGPAGVTSGLQLWLSADHGAKASGGAAATNGQQVASWEDQSNAQRNAAQETAQGAIFSHDGLNFNPALQFNPNNRYEAVDTNLPASTSDRSIFVVASNDDPSGWSYVFGYGSWQNANHSFDFGTQGGTGTGVLVVGGDQYVSSGSWLPAGSARLANGAVEDGTLKLALNGGTFTAYGQSLDTLLDGSIRIGSQSGEYEHWNGKISENYHL